MDPPTVKLKALRPVRLEFFNMREEDSLLEIPGLGLGTIRVPPRRASSISFTPLANLGVYDLRSLPEGKALGTVIIQTCPPEQELPNPVPATPQSVAAGSVLYARDCASCHGLTGRGDGSAIPRPGLRPLDFTKPFMAYITDGELYWVIGEGAQGMPSFKARLSETDRWNLVNYLRTLRSE